MTGEVLTICAAIGTPLLSSGVILFFMRRFSGAQDATMRRIERRMDCFETSQHACQIDLERRFATREDLIKLDDKVDGLDGRLSRLEGEREKRVA